MEGVAALGHVHDVLAMQNVVGNHVVERLAHAQTLGVVIKAGCGVSVVYLLDLATGQSGAESGAVSCGIANGEFN